MYVCNCHTPLQAGLKITNRHQHIGQFSFFSFQRRPRFHYLTKVILNKNSFLFLPLQFVLAINVKKRNLITLKSKDLVSFNTYHLIPVVNKSHYKCKIVTEYLFVLLTKSIVVSSLFKLKLITETYQWMLKLTTRPEHSFTNSAAIFRFQYNTQTIWTWSQPLHIPSSARSRAAKTHLIQNLI